MKRVQAAEWAGKRAEEYAKANRFRVTAEGFAALAGQERIYDSDTFNSWLAAKLDGKEKEAEFFERRFRDEYRPAFAAWMKTDRFNKSAVRPCDQEHSGQQNRNAYRRKRWPKRKRRPKAPASNGRNDLHGRRLVVATRLFCD